MMKYTLFLSLIVIMPCAGQTHEHKHNKDIVLINFGNADRTQMANLVNVVNRLLPKVIAIDAQFSMEKDENTDNRLIEALDGCNNLVMVSVIDNYSPPKINYHKFIPGCLPKFTRNAKTGFVNLVPENDNITLTKRFSQWEYVNGELELSFALQIVDLYDPIKSENFRMRYPNICEVDYSAGLTQFKRFTISEIIMGTVNKEDIEGKIVMIGFLGPGDLDKFVSPLGSKTKPLKPDLYGLEFQAQIVAQILNE